MLYCSWELHPGHLCQSKNFKESATLDKRRHLSDAVSTYFFTT